MTLRTWSTTLHQGPEGIPDKVNLLLDGEGLLEGFAAEYESGLWCDTAIAYSAAFCTRKLFLASVGTASVLKIVRLGLD